MSMRITNIKCHVLLDPAFESDATSSAQDDLVVEIETDEGIVGIGESDINAWIGRACIEAPGTHTMDAGLRQVLIGLNPLDPPGVWQKAYVATAMSGRRGALVHALGAIDMALWDICGKAEGVPTWQLLGKKAPSPGKPYASLLPHARSFDALLDSFVRQTTEAQQLGFTAAKLELVICGPYASTGLDESDERMVEIIAAVRETAGPNLVLMVDVGYAWDDVSRARDIIETWVDYGVYFVETPLWVDDLDGYAELARTSPIPIAAGEWMATHFEFRELVQRGCLHVLQPDVGRVGGLTEARRVCELASRNNLLVVPHAWKTGITVAATAQLAMVASNIPYFEMVPRQFAESALRRELLSVEPEVCDGGFTLPDVPGLGFELDREALERFSKAAESL
jgi:L-alanine-DL-glutamate epimerase-like enolase superfamily enzyme